MHKSTSEQRNSFKRHVAVNLAVGGLGVLGTVLVGAVPVNAAESAIPFNGRVAVFMVPLAMLIFAILFEVARVAWRGPLPEQAPERRTASRYWQAGRDEG